ncbi:MAG: hypothetical protein ACP5P9_03355 [Acidimicrobiales bacterium]
MAEVSLEGDDVVLHLSRLEKVEGVHGDLRVPRSAVAGVEVLDDAHRAADFASVKVGTRLFGVVEVGTMHGTTRTVFAAVHHDTPRGVRLTLTGADQDEWVVGCANPESVAASLVAGGLPAAG